MGYSRLSVNIGQIKPRAGVEKISHAAWLKDLRSDSGHLREQEVHDPWVLPIDYPQEFPSPPGTLLPLHQSFLLPLPSPVFSQLPSTPVLPCCLMHALPFQVAIFLIHLPYVALSSTLLRRPLGSLRIQPAVLGFFQKPSHYSNFPSPAASDWPS